MVEEVSAKPLNIFTEDTCDFCLNNEERNKNGLFEQLLLCKDCSAKAHPSCMKYSAELAKAALSYAWQCIECKTCSICNTADDAAYILFCDACDKAYHMDCHVPNIKEKPVGTWKCHNCVSKSSRKKNETEKTVNIDVNNPQNWSVSEVFEYFSSIGFEEEAKTFTFAEVDGAALMLLKREDVVSNMGIKLGPAVKIFDAVYRLQYKRNEALINSTY